MILWTLGGVWLACMAWVYLVEVRRWRRYYDVPALAVFIMVAQGPIWLLRILWWPRWINTGFDEAWRK